MLRCARALAGLFLAVFLGGQTAPAPRFEVATIKPSSPDEVAAGYSGISTGHGRATGVDVTLKRCVIGSFHVGPGQVIGGPSWIDDDRFHIEAKTSQPVNDNDTLDAMMRTLLEDRFHLVVHREIRNLQALVLETGKGIPKLIPGDGGGATTSAGPGSLRITNENMDDFAERLARITSLPVVNQTALSGKFNLTLLWTPDGNQPKLNDPPDLYTAIQEQLGLKLSSKKAPVSVLVVDHADKPTPN